MLAAWVLAGLVGGCSTGTEPGSAPSAAGRYGLASVDGSQAGARNEELALFGDSSYVWRGCEVIPNYYQTTVSLTEVSAGTWVQAGSRLTLAPATGAETLTGVLRRDSITIEVGGHVYGFGLKPFAHRDGAYVVTRYDGYQLPFTEPDSSGVSRTVMFGVLQLATYSTHALNLYEMVRYPNGSSTNGWVTLLSGPYYWNGDTLVLQDRARVPRLSGGWVVDGDVLAIRGLGHSYELAYNTQLPHY